MSTELVLMRSERQIEALAKQFEYGLSDADAREAAIERSVELVLLDRQMHSTAWKIGDRLMQQKAALEHGVFGQWAKDVWGRSTRYAEMFMGVREHFGTEEEYFASGFADFGMSAQLEMAKPTTPASAVTRLIEMRAETSDDVPMSQVRGVIQEERAKNGSLPKKAKPEPLSFAATCEILRKYAQRQPEADRRMRLQMVAEGSLTNFLPRNTYLVDAEVARAKTVVLSEMGPMEPPVTPVSKVVYFGEEPSYQVDDAPMTQRVTLRESEWEMLSHLGEGDAVEGIRRLLRGEEAIMKR